VDWWVPFILILLITAHISHLIAALGTTANNTCDTSNRYYLDPHSCPETRLSLAFTILIWLTSQLPRFTFVPLSANQTLRTPYSSAILPGHPCCVRLHRKETRQSRYLEIQSSRGGLCASHSPARTNTFVGEGSVGFHLEFLYRTGTSVTLDADSGRPLLPITTGSIVTCSSLIIMFACVKPGSRQGISEWIEVQ
jgi:hypothetical protein